MWSVWTRKCFAVSDLLLCGTVQSLAANMTRSTAKRASTTTLHNTTLPTGPTTQHNTTLPTGTTTQHNTTLPIRPTTQQTTTLYKQQQQKQHPITVGKNLVVAISIKLNCKFGRNQKIPKKNSGKGRDKWNLIYSRIILENIYEQVIPDLWQN